MVRRDVSRAEGLPTEEIDVIDAGWVTEESGLHAALRDPMPTLLDLDPLRHDIFRHNPRRDPTRDSMPTLPEIDPLQYDQPDDTS